MTLLTDDSITSLLYKALDPKIVNGGFRQRKSSRLHRKAAAGAGAAASSTSELSRAIGPDLP